MVLVADGQESNLPRLCDTRLPDGQESHRYYPAGNVVRIIVKHFGEKRLKMKITAIEIQKNSPSRCSIFINDEFFYGVDRETIAKLNLKEGQEIEHKALKKVIYEEEFKRAKSYAFKLLSYRARSQQEIIDRFKKKNYNSSIMQKVIEHLKALNFINDKNFAYAWAQSRLAIKPAGKQRLRQELWQKGIAKEIIEEVISSVYQKGEEEKLAKELVQRKYKIYQNLDNLAFKRKMERFLLRRGFSYEVIEGVIKGVSR